MSKKQSLTVTLLIIILINMLNIVYPHSLATSFQEYENESLDSICSSAHEDAAPLMNSGLKLATRWDIVWGGDDGDIGSAIASDGEYLYVTGETGFGTGPSNILLLKLDQMGNVIWARAWGTEEWDRGVGLYVGNNAIYVGGERNLLKFSKSGELIWAKTIVLTYDSGNLNSGASSIEIAGNEIYVGSHFGYLAKLLEHDGSLSVEWVLNWSGCELILSKVYGDSIFVASHKSLIAKISILDGECYWATWLSDVVISDMAVSDNGIFIAGRWSDHCIICKLNFEGVLLWAKIWNLSDAVGEAIYIKDNLVYVVGCLGFPFSDCFILVLDTDGNLICDYIYRGSGDGDECFCDVIVLGGELYAVGEAFTSHNRDLEEVEGSLEPVDVNVKYSDTFFFEHVQASIEDVQGTVVSPDGSDKPAGYDVLIASFGVYGENRPDLTIDEVYWSPSDIYVGDYVELFVNVENRGAVDADGFYVSIYVDDVLLQKEYVDGLAAKSLIELNFGWVADSAGTHKFKIIVDSYNDVDETNEDNNVKVVNIEVKEKLNKPPIAYIDYISPNPAKVGEEVTFSGHGEDLDGDLIVDYEWKSSIDGVLSHEKTFSTSTLSPGTHTIYFRVKDERGAWSKWATMVLEIVGVAKKPDLRVQKIEIYPEEIMEGDRIMINVYVENIGDAKSAPFKVVVYVDDVKLFEHTDMGLNPGGYNVWGEFWTAYKGSCGEHTVRVIVDVYNEVDESNEENNEFTVTFTVECEGPEFDWDAELAWLRDLDKSLTAYIYIFDLDYWNSLTEKSDEEIIRLSSELIAKPLSQIQGRLEDELISLFSPEIAEAYGIYSLASDLIKSMAIVGWMFNGTNNRERAAVLAYANEVNPLDKIKELRLHVREAIQACEERDMEKYYLMLQTIASEARETRDKVLSFENRMEGIPTLFCQHLWLFKATGNLQMLLNATYVHATYRVSGEPDVLKPEKVLPGEPVVYDVRWIVDGREVSEVTPGEEVHVFVKMGGEPFRSLEASIIIQILEESPFGSKVIKSGKIDNVVLDAGEKEEFAITFRASGGLFTSGYRLVVKYENAPVYGMCITEGFALTTPGEYPLYIKLKKTLSFSGIIIRLFEKGSRLHLLAEVDGKYVGFKDGEVVEEVEGSKYLILSDGVAVVLPEVSEFKLYVIASEAHAEMERYNLSIVFLENDNVLVEKTLTDISIWKGEKKGYSIRVKTDEYIPELEVKSEEEGEEKTLYYDDGEADLATVAPKGVIAAVKFTVEKPVQILRLIYYICGYSPVRLKAVILDSNQKIIFSREFISPEEPEWISIDVSDAKIFVSGDFYVGYQWVEEPCVGNACSGMLLVDEDPPCYGRSYMGREGDLFKEREEDYMIRVTVKSLPKQDIHENLFRKTLPYVLRGRILWMDMRFYATIKLFNVGATPHVSVTLEYPWPPLDRYDEVQATLKERGIDFDLYLENLTEIKPDLIVKNEEKFKPRIYINDNLLTEDARWKWYTVCFPISSFKHSGFKDVFNKDFACVLREYGGIEIPTEYSIIKIEEALSYPYIILTYDKGLWINVLNSPFQYFFIFRIDVDGLQKIGAFEYNGTYFRVYKPMSDTAYIKLYVEKLQIPNIYFIIFVIIMHVPIMMMILIAIRKMKKKT